MGAWGAGYFENDLTCDALPYYLEQTEPFSCQLKTVQDVLDNSEYLEVDDCAALVVIAILQIGLGGDWVKRTESLKEMYVAQITDFVDSHQAEWDESWANFKDGEGRRLVQLTSLCLEKCLDPKISEDAELWGETEYFDEWKQSITDLIDELNDINDKYRLSE